MLGRLLGAIGWVEPVGSGRLGKRGAGAAVSEVGAGTGAACTVDAASRRDASMKRLSVRAAWLVFEHGGKRPASAALDRGGAIARMMLATKARVM